MNTYIYLIIHCLRDLMKEGGSGGVTAIGVCNASKIYQKLSPKR